MEREMGRAGVISLDDAGEDPERMAEDVRTGLLGVPKDLSPWPKYFYDANGSELFEEITELPEYYQTRTELSILREKSDEIVSRTACRQLVELGSGSASKPRALLDAMLRFFPDGRTVRYVPLDVSESALRESGERMAFARYSPEGPGDSLYFVEDGQAFSHMGGCGLRAPGQRRGVAGDAGPASASRR